jgi:hypothetical protein
MRSLAKRATGGSCNSLSLSSFSALPGARTPLLRKSFSGLVPNRILSNTIVIAQHLLALAQRSERPSVLSQKGY